MSNLKPKPPNPPPPPLPQPLKLTTRQTVMHAAAAPLCREVDTSSGVDISWTGLADILMIQVLVPAAIGCYRPIDPDKARKVEDKCVQPLNQGSFKL